MASESRRPLLEDSDRQLPGGPERPLLEGPEQPLLLEGPGGSANNGSTRLPTSQPSSRTPEEWLQDEEHARYARSASRVVTYTVWFLLAAVMIGTIIGIIFVTIPMQQGSIPGPRKSPALLVVAGDHQQELMGGLRKSGTVQDKVVVEAVVWSGKGRHTPFPLNDLFSFNAMTTIWSEVSDQVQTAGSSDAPIPRWKAAAVHEPGAKSLLIQGGDPLAADGPSDHYLEDTWRLSLDDPHNPTWTKLQTVDANGSDIRPPARRAHVGVVYFVDGIPTLTVYGGRAKDGELLSDVWSTPLENTTHLDWFLKRNLDDDFPDPLSQPNPRNKTEVASDEESYSKKHHKRSTHNYPGPRKGHLAVAVQDSPHHPLMIILGGRNDTHYFSDIWRFDHKGNSWTKLGQKGRTKPTPRDHFGGFYHNGLIYIFGGRGSVDAEYAEPKTLGDFWTYDLETEEWTELHPKGPQPLARFLYGMDTYTVSDAEGDLRFVIMGGEGPKSCYLNDLWEYSVAQNTWKQWGALKPEPGKKKCQSL